MFQSFRWKPDDISKLSPVLWPNVAILDPDPLTRLIPDPELCKKRSSSVECGFAREDPALLGSAFACGKAGPQVPEFESRLDSLRKFCPIEQAMRKMENLGK